MKTLYTYNTAEPQANHIQARERWKVDVLLPLLLIFLVWLLSD